MTQDKQLREVSLEAVVEKRRLDQALNAKEFAVLVGISYSAARSWFRSPGFPVFRGVVFWQDFVQWRSTQNGLDRAKADQVRSAADGCGRNGSSFGPRLSARAEQLLAEAR
jgi:hypothetical protein